MLRGLYTAAAGMISNMIASDTIANNLANVTTVGYKRNAVNFQAFPQMMMQRMGDESGDTSGSGLDSQVGGIMTGSKVYSTAINFEQGQLKDTANPLDMALNGEGFFTVKTKSGQTLYTRNGEFTISPDNYLVDKQGNYVQGELGNILVPPNTANVKISPSGVITANNQVLDKLVINRFKNDNTLEKVGDSYYSESDTNQLLPQPNANDPAPYQVRQGMVELSNANPVMELVKTLEGLRVYEALQKNIHMHNETLDKAVNQVGLYK